MVKELGTLPKRENVPWVIAFNQTKMVLYGLVLLEIRVRNMAGQIHHSQETYVSIGNALKDVMLGIMYLEKYDSQRD